MTLRFRSASTHQVRRHRELRGPQRELEDAAHDQHDKSRDDQDEVTLALALLGLRRGAGERHHWVRFGVRRVDCTHGVSAASPAIRATQEFSPFSETSERTRT